MSKTKGIRKNNMIKTLRITSIIAVVLAAGLLVFPAIFGLRSDKEIEDFLNLPGVVEKFRQARGDERRTTKDEISPLVAAAQVFGRYLNPPPPPRPVITKRDRPPKPTAVPLPPTPKERVHSAKFNLIATSVHATQPELSLALIDQPGKGRNWVRPGTVVSYLTIEQIKDGFVVLKGTKETFEKPVQPRPLQRSLSAGSPGIPVSLGASNQIGSEPGPPLVSTTPDSVSAADTGTPGTGQMQKSPEEMAAAAADIYAHMAAMAEGHDASAGTGSDAGAGIDPEKLREVFADYAKNLRISSEEAKTLGNLGQKPEDAKQDPNRPKSKKVEQSKRNYKPRKRATPRPRKRSTSKPKPKPKD
jgi:hypothetical protein